MEMDPTCILRATEKAWHVRAQGASGFGILDLGFRVWG